MKTAEEIVDEIILKLTGPYLSLPEPARSAFRSCMISVASFARLEAMEATAEIAMNHGDPNADYEYGGGRYDAGVEIADAIRAAALGIQVKSAGGPGGLQ